MRKLLLTGAILALGVGMFVAVANADNITLGAEKNALYGRLDSGGVTYDVGWRASSPLCFVSFDSGYYRVYNNLYQFDISEMAGNTINGATLRLYCNSASSNDNVAAVSAHQVSPSTTGQVSEWAEPTATGFSSSNPPTGVSGLYRNAPDNQSWDAQYGDYGAALDTTLVDNDTGGAGWYEWDVTVAAQNWMAGDENLGLAIISASTDDSTGAYRTFAGRTNGTSANRPQLVLDYTPIPEPGTMLLLGSGIVGLVGVIRRRRMK